MNTDPKYSYEIDFLPVGDGKKSGDAIAMRWWRGEWSKERQKVMVIDGGTKESGEKLVEHIKKYYKTERVDHAINTHPDQDHASGLTEVLENLEVRELWMHRPWEHIEEIVKFVDRNSNFKGDKRATVDSIRDRFSWEYYQYAKELEKLDSFVFYLQVNLGICLILYQTLTRQRNLNLLKKIQIAIEKQAEKTKAV
ncbi:MBL fold metallo-hydrolase [Helicobacter pylori]|uniref:MBL fold metallo-hydrolase n=1 Tax=Helicobacter pylori TaxID=210 RepID=UPI001C56CB28|nr:MBL fold metallo-hydrolase [Helicobacter pylori]